MMKLKQFYIGSLKLTSIFLFLIVFSVITSCGGGGGGGAAAGGDGLDASKDATNDAGKDATNDAGGDATTDAGGDATNDAGKDATNDAGGDATSDAGGDATSDASKDATSDATKDATSDAGKDATKDATGNTPPVVLKETGIKVSTVTTTSGAISKSANLIKPNKINLGTGITSLYRKGENDYLITYSSKMMELTFTGDKASLVQLPITNLPEPGTLKILDSASGKYYVVYEQLVGANLIPYIYLLSSTYAATKILGNGTIGLLEGPIGTSLPYYNSRGGVVIGGDLYIGNKTAIRKMSLTAPYAVTKLAGGINSTLVKDGIGTDARVNEPGNLLLAPNNKIIFNDYRTVRQIDIVTKEVKTIAGTLKIGKMPIFGHDDSPNPLTATFGSTASIARSPSGNIYVTELNYNYIRKIAGTNGVYGAVTTIVGSGAKGRTDTVADKNMYHNPLLADLTKPGNLFFEGDTLFFIDNARVLRKVEFLDATP